MRIALYRGTGFISKAIEWQTRGEYSHASAFLRDGSVVESREGVGVQHIPEPKPDKGETYDVFEIPTTPDQDELIEKFLLAQVGKPYDYVSILRFISRSAVPHWQRLKWFCSELVFAALEIGGVLLLRDTEAWEVSPGLLGRSPLLIPAK